MIRPNFFHGTSDRWKTAITRGHLEVLRVILYRLVYDKMLHNDASSLHNEKIKNLRRENSESRWKLFGNICENLHTDGDRY